jgi:hypothetical protein
VPVIRSAISKYINDTEQGKTMAALAAVESLAGLLAPLIFNQVGRGKNGGASHPLRLVHDDIIPVKFTNLSSHLHKVYPATIHVMPSATFGVGCGKRHNGHVDAAMSAPEI